MKRSAAFLSAFIFLQAGASTAQTASQVMVDQGRRVLQEATGNFDIQTKPEATIGDGIGRFSLDKTFHGDIEGKSVGEMLAVRTSTPGSAGYVLIEHVTGKVKGRTGGFMLQHYGLMNRSKPELKVSIIPDSGTGDLAGIAGEMTINASDNHSYVLTYSLPVAP
jgi:hypothetical protein